jgi:hypothetical protein
MGGGTSQIFPCWPEVCGPAQVGMPPPTHWPAHPWLARGGLAIVGWLDVGQPGWAGPPMAGQQWSGPPIKPCWQGIIGQLLAGVGWPTCKICDVPNSSDLLTPVHFHLGGPHPLAPLRDRLPRKGEL